MSPDGSADADVVFAKSSSEFTIRFAADSLTFFRREDLTGEWNCV